MVKLPILMFMSEESGRLLISGLVCCCHQIVYFLDFLVFGLKPWQQYKTLVRVISLADSWSNKKGLKKDQHHLVSLSEYLLYVFFFFFFFFK